MIIRAPQELLAEAITGLWTVEGMEGQHPGVLQIAKGVLRLTVFTGASFDIETMRARRAAGPSPRPTCRGVTQRAGRVTLLRCLQVESTSSRDRRDPRSELTFICEDAWAGADFIEPDAGYRSLTFEVRGFHGVLAPEGADLVYLAGEAERAEPVDAEADDDPSETERARLRKGLWELTKAREVFIVRDAPTEQANITAGGRNFTISVWTGLLGGDQSGYRLSTSIRIESEGATVKELLRVRWDLQVFLSIFAIGPFIPSDTMVFGGDLGPAATLLWRLGDEEPTEPLERRRLDVVTSFADNPAALAAAIERWFQCSDERRLSRWLVHGTLGEHKLSVPRFLALSQAWELAGRELHKGDVSLPTEFEQASNEAVEVFSKALGKDTAKRVKGMLRSLRRPGYLDYLRAALAECHPKARREICGDATRFAKTVKACRDTLTHMQPRPEMTIDDARALSVPLTYKLATLFCILECGRLGIPMDNLDYTLRFNENARDATTPLPLLVEG